MLTIFLCHASEDKPIAEPIQLALANAGYEVFYDETSLPPGGDYQNRIHQAIKHCDLFVFLISKASISRGKFTLTELKFAREKWPSPVSRVLPVNVENIPVRDIPSYLSSTTILSVRGNAAAEVRAAVKNMLENQYIDLNHDEIEVEDLSKIKPPDDKKLNDRSSEAPSSWPALVWEILKSPKILICFAIILIAAFIGFILMGYDPVATIQSKQLIKRNSTPIDECLGIAKNLKKQYYIEAATVLVQLKKDDKAGIVNKNIRSIYTIRSFIERTLTKYPLSRVL